MAPIITQTPPPTRLCQIIRYASYRFHLNASVRYSFFLELNCKCVLASTSLVFFSSCKLHNIQKGVPKQMSIFHINI